MAAATESASSTFSGLPASSVCWSCLYTSLGRRWRCTAGEKTLTPKTSALGAVRSWTPRADPFGAHWAAETLFWRSRGMARTLTGHLGAPVVRVDKAPRTAFRPMAGDRPAGTTAPAGTSSRGTTTPPPGETETALTRFPDTGGPMRRTWLARALVMGVLAALLVPSAALAQDAPKLPDVVTDLNTTWVVVAGVLVMFMQAGFLFLELGFTRG